MSCILFSNLTFLIFFFYSNVRFQPLQFSLFCLGKKKSTQNRLFSICVSKKVICAGKKMPTQNRFFSIYSSGMVVLRWQNYFSSLIFSFIVEQLQQQTKLIAECLYFLIRNSIFQFLCNMYDPCHSVIFRKELKKQRPLSKSNKILPIKYNQAARMYC